jgi:signal transduction histidine kinase
MSARVLIVDDEAANVQLLDRILRHHGITDVLGLTDSREAQAAVETFRPDVILLDLLMPNLDGFALLERLGPRLREEAVPVLVLTADATPETRDRALSSGAKDFVTKPFDPGEVVLRIQNLLETRALHLAVRAENRRLAEEVSAHSEELGATLEMLRHSEERRRRLLAELSAAEEEERRRIAADIHDDPVQKMTAAALQIAALRRRLDDPGLAAAAEEAERVVEGAVGRLRSLMFELRPASLDSDGLAAAIRELAAHLSEDDGPSVEVHNDLSREPPGEQRVVLYRIAREALHNVARHSRASSASVWLAESEGGYSIRIEDDGVGFDAAGQSEPPGHLGLTSMVERAETAGGRCRIVGIPGKGTVVEAWVPSEP